MPRCKYDKLKFEPKYFNQKFCLKTDACIKAFSDYANSEKEKNKAWKKVKKDVKKTTHSKEYKNQLQIEINKLARMIDKKFGFDYCIDCDKKFISTPHGGHFNSVGSNSSLRFNLDNIHSQKGECNEHGKGGGRKLEYKEGLIKRYGHDYAEMVHKELAIKYPVIKLNHNEIYEKLTLVRKLIKNFDTYQFESSLNARKLLNNLIGIYN